MKASGIIRLGVLTGLFATALMDGAMVLALRLLGRPPGIFFSFVGDSAAAFGCLLRIEVSGGTTHGVVLHYLIGFSLAILFVAVVRRRLLPSGGVPLTLVVAIVFVECASLVLLIPAVRLLELKAVEMRDVFSLAVVFHGVWGLALGAAYLYGTRAERAVAAGQAVDST